MQYRRGRKKGETHWIGSALRQGEVKTLQHSDYTIWWFRDSLHIRWRHAPSRSLFHLRFVFLLVSATLFVCTLYHSTLRWAIWRNATPFVRTLCYSTLPWAIWRNASATLFVYCIANEFQAICNWASPFHNFMFQLDMGNWTVYHLTRLFMFRVFCFMMEN